MDHSDPATETRRRMVAGQIASRGVSDPRVLDAMVVVPRERFVPDDERAAAFDDHPLPIGRGQTISQPYIVALMTEALGPGPADTVLEIGAGSGYQSAILAHLARHVCALERDPVLAARARQTLADLGITNVDLRCGDGFSGWPEPDTSFDGILVACAADHVPPALLRQLAPRGRLVIPLGGPGDTQELKVLEKSTAGGVTSHSLGWVRFVPMVPGIATPTSPQEPLDG